MEFTNARLVLPDEIQRGSLSVRDGQIHKISKDAKPAANGSKSGDKRSDKKPDRRDFDIESYDFAKAQKEAMEHFSITDKNMIASKVLDKGSKKFFIFGPRLTKFRFYPKPLKRIVLPFLIELVKKSKLDVYVSVHQNRGDLDLVFKGNDLGLLLTNRQALLKSFETLTYGFLQDKLNAARNVKIRATVDQGGKDDKGKKDQEEDLVQLVEKTKTRIKQTRRPVTLRRALNPAQRRIIHKHLEGSEFKSESLGDGRMKKIKISQAR